MNERIKKLFMQACQHADYEHQNVPKELVEKFAELIVRECSDFVYGYPHKYLTRNQAREICLKMNENFGVE